MTLRARVAIESGSLDIDAETTVLRSEFGLGGVLPLARDEVTISLHLRATPHNCEG